MVDTPVLGTGAERCGGSSPPLGTHKIIRPCDVIGSRTGLKRQVYGFESHRGYKCLSGEIGSHAGLRSQCCKKRESSSLSLGTKWSHGVVVAQLPLKQ